MLVFAYILRFASCLEKEMETTVFEPPTLGAVSGNEDRYTMTPPKPLTCLTLRVTMSKFLKQPSPLSKCKSPKLFNVLRICFVKTLEIERNLIC